MSSLDPPLDSEGSKKKGARGPTKDSTVERDVYENLEHAKISKVLLARQRSDDWPLCEGKGKGGVPVPDIPERVFKDDAPALLDEKGHERDFEKVPIQTISSTEDSNDEEESPSKSSKSRGRARGRYENVEDTLSDLGEMDDIPIEGADADIDDMDAEVEYSSGSVSNDDENKASKETKDYDSGEEIDAEAAAATKMRTRKKRAQFKKRAREEAREYLTQKQIDFFNKEGYLVIHRFWKKTQVATLRDQITSIINNMDLSANSTIFSSKEQKRVSDDYYLTSGRAIRYFWEENAKDEHTGAFNGPIEEMINKIGHGLHDMDPEFEKVTYEHRLGSISRQLGLEHPLAVQSMFIFKNKKIGGEVCPHQDGSFLYTEPQTCIGYWWCLDECRQDNGCLWAVPGSHKQGVNRRFRRKEAQNDYGGTEFVKCKSGEIDSGPEEWDLTGAVPLEIPAGSLVIIHNALVHYSEENKSDKSRWAYSVHVVDGQKDVVYPADNWLQRPAEYPFRVLP